MCACIYYYDAISNMDWVFQNEMAAAAFKYKITKFKQHFEFHGYLTFWHLIDSSNLFDKNSVFLNGDCSKIFNSI